MALAHISLNMTGKRKSKVKFKSASAAQQARELERDWAAIKAKHGVVENKRKQRATVTETLTYSLQAPPGRTTTQHIPSRDTGHTGTISSKKIPTYTGTKMLGIGVMHKSNAVPVFSEEEAIDIATMRRG